MAKFYTTLTVLWCIFGAALVKGFDKEAAMANFMANIDDCKKEVGAKDADVEELVSKMPASSMEGKCLRSCLMKKFEVMDNNGKFVKAVAITNAGKFTDGAEDKMEMANKIIDTCANINVASDHCEAAEQYGKCIMEQVVVHGLTETFDF